MITYSRRIQINWTAAAQSSLVVRLKTLFPGGSATCDSTLTAASQQQGGQRCFNLSWQQLLHNTRATASPFLHCTLLFTDRLYARLLTGRWKQLFIPRLLYKNWIHRCLGRVLWSVTVNEPGLKILNGWFKKDVAAGLLTAAVLLTLSHQRELNINHSRAVPEAVHRVCCPNRRGLKALLGCRHHLPHHHCTV